MTLVKYRPSHMNSVNSNWNTVLDNFFQRDFNAVLGVDQNTFSPSVNVLEVDNGFRIELAAPGYKKEDFSLEVTKNKLTISAEVKEEKENKKERYTRREFRKASFSRSFNLHESVDGEKISAVFTDGILNIELPKNKEEKKKNRAIEIK